MSSDRAPEKVYYCKDVKEVSLYNCGGTNVITYIREDLAPKQDHIADASKMVDQLTGQPEFKNFKDQYAKAVIDREVKLANDWYNRGLNEALKINLKIAEEQRRREMFEKVALAVLNDDVGKTIEYESEWLSIVYRRTRQILEAADKFAKGEE